MPRHSWHTGYGLRDLRRVMTGPAYARALVSAAVAAGAELRTGTTVTGWTTGPDGSHAVTMTSEGGIETVPAAAVLLATGCRERPRTARLVPGDRPAGVMTTGELQQRVYLGGERLAGRALVVGAEHVSFSAAVTLAHAGADVVALVTGYERQQSYAAFRFGAAVRWRVPVWTCERGVGGSPGAGGWRAWRWESGPGRPGSCRASRWCSPGTGFPTTSWRGWPGWLDPGTRGPAVDTALATSAPGVFAAGNLVHAAETADIAALSGRHAARQIAAFLRRGPERRGPERRGPGSCGGGVRGSGPEPGPGPGGAAAALDLAERDRIAAPPPLGRFVLRSPVFRRGARLEVRQDGRLLARSRPVRLIPERPVHLGAGWLDRVDPAGGPVRVLTTPAYKLRWVR